MKATNPLPAPLADLDPQPPLRAVPPQERRAAGLTPPTPPVQSAPPAKRSPWRPWLIGGGMLVALAAIASLKIPNYATGEATIEARFNARDRLIVPRGGIVRIQVARNSSVRAGEAVATIESPELAEQLAEAERGLAQAQGALQAAQQNLVIAETRQQASAQEAAIAQQRAQDSQADLRALETGSGLPRSRQIQQEQAALGQEIRALESQIAGSESEIAAASHEIAEWTRQLDHKRSVYADRYALTQLENPPISENHPLVEGLKGEILDLERRIQAASDRQQVQRHAIAETRELIAQRQRQIAARGEQVLEVARQTQDEFQSERDDWLLTRTRSQSSAREVAAAETEVRAQLSLVAQWEQEVARLQQEQEALVLRAKTSGTVIADDLDLKDGRHLAAGETVLEIANLRELRAIVAIRQEDYRLVELSQPVKFQAPGDEPYRAAVSDLEPTIQTETPGAAPMASVEILIDNETNRLLPGGEGHAHIRTGQLRIYQKAQHELGKLFNVGKWVPW